MCVYNNNSYHSNTGMTISLKWKKVWITLCWEEVGRKKDIRTTIDWRDHKIHWEHWKILVAPQDYQRKYSKEARKGRICNEILQEGKIESKIYGILRDFEESWTCDISTSITTWSSTYSPCISCIKCWESINMKIITWLSMRQWKYILFNLWGTICENCRS